MSTQLTRSTWWARLDSDMSNEQGLGRRPHARVVLARWTVLIGAAYLVLYGRGESLPLWQQAAVLGTLLTSLGLHGAAIRSGAWRRYRWPITLADITLAILAVAFTGHVTNDFFLFFFLTLMIAGISGQFGLTILATCGLCVVYVFILYSQQEAALWRMPELLIRVPFLFGVGLFFGTVSDEARTEESRAARLSDVTRKMVQRYHQVASERDRTQALLEIGQLALSGRDPADVLRDIVKQVRSTVRVDRCSMLIFNESERHAYLAACTDDDDLVSLLLPLKHYPELEAALESGEIIELHPDRPSELWERVRKHLPKPHQYRSWLVVPILRRGMIAGAIFLRDSRPDFEFHTDEKLFCEAAAMMTASFLRDRDLVEEMRRRSRLDGLTGLLNFMAFREELHQALTDHRETEGAKPLSLIMIDVDNLKIVNDRYGHLVGNQVIERVGRQLARALPMATAACRYGGDEFFALVPLTRTQAAERAERLVIALEDRPESMPCEISVSIGVSGFPEDGELDDHLLDAADRAMYIAKSEGGNRVRIADESEYHRGRVYEAVIAVNARRLIPGDRQALRDVLDELLRMQEQELDSAAARQSLRALMAAVESKDKYTGEHSAEVSDLTGRLGAALGLGEKELLAVSIGALVHDIGKIGIPDEILQKPGPLTTRERLQIEQHPEIGAQILAPLPALHDVVPLVLHHHERWDGTGYPHRLSGPDIPLGAQIISVCDVWSALTSDRSYRKAFSDEKARGIILEGRGAEWSPQLVDLFFTVLAGSNEQESRLTA